MKVHVIYILLIAIVASVGVYFHMENKKEKEALLFLYKKEIDSLQVLYHKKDSILVEISKRGTKYETRYKNNPKPYIPTLSEQQLDRAIDSILYTRP